MESKCNDGEKEMWELFDVITDVCSASEQQNDTPAGPDPAESSPGQKQGLPSLSERYPPVAARRH